MMHLLMSSPAIMAIAVASASPGVQPRISVEPLMLTDDALSSPVASPPPPPPLQAIAPRTTVLIDAPVMAADDTPLSDADLALLVPEKKVAASLPPQPLGQFAETVLGQILGVPYIMGPGVSQRRDLVSMSGPQEMSSRQFLRLAEKALNQYGLVLAQQGGAILVREAPARAATLQPKTGVTQIVALGNIAADPAAGIVADIVEGQGGVSVQSLPDANGVMLQGEEAGVAAAGGFLAGIDQPQYTGARVARIAPMLWSADALAEKLREVLASEGFAIGAAGSGGTSLVHLSRPDCLLLFSDDVRLFNRVLYWVEQLDSLEGSGGDHAGFFVYQVRNTTAAELGSLVGRANGGDDSSGIAAPQGRIDDSARRSDSGQRSSGMERGGLPEASSSGADSGKIIVDNPGNRILFRGSRREYAPLLRLLKELDVAPKQVLVEITIAEVTLTDETRFGMEWFLDRQLSNGSVQANTTGGLAREAGGLGLTFAKGFAQTSVTAALNAIATNQNLNIISTPRLLARSGGEAQILIGNDVPIITSQRAADIQSNGDTDILQTVQYRQTGVILNIRPVVLSNDRIDIEIFQEVSSQQPNVTSAIGSPVISNRSVTTRLSLREGMTAVLGGMIQDSNSMGQRGVPLLKDIPLLGRAFRVDSATKRKTELLILVTPKVISEDRTMQNIASEFGKSINGLMNGRGQKAFTLVPWMPGQTMPVHRYSRFENPK